MTLEQQLTALLEKHDLTALTIVANRRGDGSVYFSAYAHHGGECASSGTYDAGISRPLKEAIARMAAKRVVVPAMEAA